MDHTYFILSILVCFSRLALAADPPAPSPSVPTTIAPTTVPSTIPAIICTPACEHDGVCIAATDGVNHCDCTSTGYTNDTCDTECGPGACLNNGTCISNVHGPGTSCHCEETFSGPTCSEGLKAEKKSGGGASFDTASFFGGIVLCAGLVAISCFGYKYYTSKKSQTYRHF